jgi:hypothetical protein
MITQNQKEQDIFALLGVPEKGTGIVSKLQEQLADYQRMQKDCETRLQEEKKKQNVLEKLISNTSEMLMLLGALPAKVEEKPAVITLQQEAMEEFKYGKHTCKILRCWLGREDSTIEMAEIARRMGIYKHLLYSWTGNRRAYNKTELVKFSDSTLGAWELTELGKDMLKKIS